MATIEAIFEHGVFRPTGPVSLPEGSRVTVVVEDPATSHPEPTADAASEKSPRRSMIGALKGKIWISPDFDEPLEEFKDYM